MLVVVIDEGLEVADLDQLASPCSIVDQRVNLQWFACVLCQEVLDLLVAEQLVLREAKDLKSLFPRYKASLDTQALLCNFLAARVAMLFGRGFVVLLAQV